MKEVLNDKLNNFSNALKRLEDAFKEEGDALLLDGTIQRFEFTFELCWKTLKKFLLYEGIECFSARDCIKKAYQIKFINDEDRWINMLKDRNITTHIYAEEEAEKIYHRIKELYFIEFKKLENVLKEKMESIE